MFFHCANHSLGLVLQKVAKAVRLWLLICWTLCKRLQLLLTIRQREKYNCLPSAQLGGGSELCHCRVCSPAIRKCYIQDLGERYECQWGEATGQSSAIAHESPQHAHSLRFAYLRYCVHPMWSSGTVYARHQWNFFYCHKLIWSLVLDWGRKRFSQMSKCQSTPKFHCATKLERNLSQSNSYSTMPDHNRGSKCFSIAFPGWELWYMLNYILHVSSCVPIGIY